MIADFVMVLARNVFFGGRGGGFGYPNDFKGMVCRTAKITTYRITSGGEVCPKLYWTVPFVFSSSLRKIDCCQERENVNYTAIVKH